MYPILLCIYNTYKVLFRSIWRIKACKYIACGRLVIYTIATRTYIVKLTIRAACEAV